MVRLESWSISLFLSKLNYIYENQVTQKKGRRKIQMWGGNYKDFWRANKDVTIEKAGWNENDFHRQENRLENWPGQLQLAR